MNFEHRPQKDQKGGFIFENLQPLLVVLSLYKSSNNLKFSIKSFSFGPNNVIGLLGLRAEATGNKTFVIFSHIF